MIGRRLLRPLCLAGALVSLSATPPSAPTTKLLSLKLPPLGPNEFVDAFDIKTQGVEIIAVCHIPYGWQVTAGIYDSVEGEARGEAGLGPSYISNANRNASELAGLLLVKIYDETDHWDGSLPPTFRITISVGEYGSEAKGRTLRLPASSLIRAAKQGCPVRPA